MPTPTDHPYIIAEHTDDDGAPTFTLLGGDWDNEYGTYPSLDAARQDFALMQAALENVVPAEQIPGHPDYTPEPIPDDLDNSVENEEVPVDPTDPGPEPESDGDDEAPEDGDGGGEPDPEDGE